MFLEILVSLNEFLPNKEWVQYSVILDLLSLWDTVVSPQVQGKKSTKSVGVPEVLGGDLEDVSSHSSHYSRNVLGWFKKIPQSVYRRMVWRLLRLLI